MLRILTVGVAAVLLVTSVALTLNTSAGEPTPRVEHRPASIQGRVTLDGQPLPFGMVHLHVERGPILHAHIHQGQFEVPHIPAGKVRVAVHAPPMVPFGLPSKENPAPPRMTQFPSKYLQPETSGLRGDLREGAQEVTLSLKSES